MRAAVRLCAGANLAAAAVLVAGGAAAPLPARAAGSGFLTNSADILRDGWDSVEPGLTPAALQAGFGRLWTSSLPATVNGSSVTPQVYAQPVIAGGHVYVATETNDLYDINEATGAVNWHVTLDRPEPSGSGAAINCTDLTPWVGVTSTPVLDGATGTLYLAHRTWDGSTAASGTTKFDAIDVSNGAERSGWPVGFSGTVTATNDAGTTFNPVKQNQRVALLLTGGHVFAGFASFCDQTPYEGWVSSIDVTSATPQSTLRMWTTEAGLGGSNALGGIWQSGDGLASTGNGDIYFVSGNGALPAADGGNGKSPLQQQLGQSFVRLAVQGDGSVATVDHFTPRVAACLSKIDLDVGSGGPTLLPDAFGSTAHPHLVVAGGKTGALYLVDRDSMGGYQPDAVDGSCNVTTPGADSIVASYPASDEPNGTNYNRADADFGRAAVWPGDGGYFYVTGVNDGQNPGAGPTAPTLRAYQVAKDGSGNITGITLAASAPLTTSGSAFGFGSSSPVVTSDGTTAGSATVWVLERHHGGDTVDELRAFSAVPSGVAGAGGQTLSELFHQNIGTATKFLAPSTDGNRVFVATNDGHVAAFGQLAYSWDQSPLAPPASLAGGASAPPRTLTVTAGAGGVAVPGAQVWMAINGAGSATANGVALTSTPQAVTTDGSGHVSVVYSAPATLPPTGTDTVVAEDRAPVSGTTPATAPAVTASNAYTFDTPAYAFSVTPLGAGGRLAHSSSVPVTLTLSLGGSANPGGTVFLAFTPVPGGGSVTVGGGACGTATTLSTTPAQCTADGSAHIALTYRTPAVLPLGGSDVITARDGSTPAASTVTQSDSYEYANGGEYRALTPARIYDSRTGSGFPGAGTRLHAGTTDTVQVAGVPGGPPASGAIAAVLSVTATAEDAYGYMTVYPANAASRPPTSSLNFTPGEDVANLVEVPLGPDGAVKVFNNAGNADVVVDVEGWVSETLDSGGTGLYTALTPQRVADTRPASTYQDQGQTLTAAHHVVTVQVTGNGGVPAGGVAAVVLNLTATRVDAPTYLTVWPSGGTRPVASNLNVYPGTDRAARVIVPVSAGGSVDIYNNSGDADAVVDVSGWFSDGVSTHAGDAFHPLVPARFCDSRGGSGTECAGQADQGLTTRPVTVAGVPGIPAMGSATPPHAVVMNLTVPYPYGPGCGQAVPDFMTVFPSGTGIPATSDINYPSRCLEDTANLAVTTVGADGVIDVFHNVTVADDYVLDAVGYYTVPL